MHSKAPHPESAYTGEIVPLSTESAIAVGVSPYLLRISHESTNRGTWPYDVAVVRFVRLAEILQVRNLPRGHATAMEKRAVPNKPALFGFACGVF